MPISTPIGGGDVRIWMPEFKGDLIVSSAKELIRQKYPKFDGAAILWRKEVHPTLAALNWKFMRNACATFAGRAWNWIDDVFNLTPNDNLVVSCKAAQGRSTMIRDLWRLANLVIRSELWAARNRVVFQRQQPSWSLFFKRVVKLIQEYFIRLRGYMQNCAEDVLLLDYFRVVHRSVKHQQPVEVFWQPPDENELQICCDGAARGNPGIVGAGVVARDANCAVIGAMSIGLGVTTNFLAELYGIIVGLEWAMQWGFERICVRSDSFSVVEAFKNSSIPWFSRSRWLAICRHYVSIRFIHTFREANFAADKTAKRGCLLANEVGVHYVGRPPLLNSVEYPNVSYYRFK
ncbi:uncharacterized protein LOC113296361 [Papaver somniferum]|uniref:uncharacterized protein LOC113296361 n=1 Tax=Papaver somniferum TaxID=3469 RepID=UPI000E7052A1|nr:uncharacterized protein LOC113296361 [Papaver somniferum]